MSSHSPDARLSKSGLSKSRFRLGWECPAKLYYSNNRKEYYDAMGDDTFMQGLAEGGYQVGELARWMLCRDPHDDLIETFDKKQALKETADRLAVDDATIGESAFEWNGLFIRADVIVKRGKTLKLYEVKSKSWDSSVSFWTKRGVRKLNSKWEEYLLDVAFQKYVIEHACPQYSVQAHLVLLDKDKVSDIDGLNRKFMVVREDRAVRVSSAVKCKEELGRDLLAYINVDRDIDEIRNLLFPLPDGGEGKLDILIDQLSRIHHSRKPFPCDVGSKCKSCQFRFPSDPALVDQLKAKGLKNGREECWANAVGKRYDNSKPKVIELWNFRKTDEQVQAGNYYLKNLTRTDIGNGKNAARQWLQIEKVQNGDSSPWIDREGLAAEMHSWKYPLHFIDFETSRMALPSLEGAAPYMQVAFQFSHHTVDKDGRVKHAGQWIDTQAGSFPSFEFVRALKRELENDIGTIFRYAPHENTVLRDIHEQLQISKELDRIELMRWIDTITYKSGGAKSTSEKIRGARNMVDMREVILSYHYDPATHGSNSLKYVLPAIIGNSRQLRKHYGKSIGAAGIHSLNFSESWIWIQPDLLRNPYTALPPIFDEEEQELLSEYARGLDDIDDGGAATLAYAKLQCFEMPGEEREAIRLALLRYCELDTLAMVMLYEYWRETTA